MHGWTGLRVAAPDDAGALRRRPRRDCTSPTRVRRRSRSSSTARVRRGDRAPSRRRRCVAPAPTTCALHATRADARARSRLRRRARRAAATLAARRARRPAAATCRTRDLRRPRRARCATGSCALVGGDAAALALIWRTPSHHIRPMPSSAPGIASTPVSRSVSSRPGRAEVDDQPEEERAEQRAAGTRRRSRRRSCRAGRREVPEGEADHDPDEHGHQRGLPCRRLRGFFGFGSASPSPSPPVAASRRRRPAARRRSPPLAAARARPPAGRPRAAAAWLAGCAAPPRCRGRATMSSNSARETSRRSGGAVIARRPPRAPSARRRPGRPASAVAYGGHVAELARGCGARGRGRPARAPSSA